MYHATSDEAASLASSKPEVSSKRSTVLMGLGMIATGLVGGFVGLHAFSSANQQDGSSSTEAQLVSTMSHKKGRKDGKDGNDVALFYWFGNSFEYTDPRFQPPTEDDATGENNEIETGCAFFYAGPYEAYASPPPSPVGVFCYNDPKFEFFGTDYWQDFGSFIFDANIGEKAGSSLNYFATYKENNFLIDGDTNLVKFTAGAGDFWQGGGETGFFEAKPDSLREITITGNSDIADYYKALVECQKVGHYDGRSFCGNYDSV